PSPPTPPAEITPLEVVQEFVAAANSDSLGRELSDDCVLSFFGRHSRGATVSSSYFRLFIASRYQHEGFEEAHYVSPARAEILKVRFMRCFSWTRRRMAEEEKVRERATSLHLRAESDDEDEQQQQQQLPSRCRAQLVTPPRSASHGLDQVKFVEADGILRSIKADYTDDGLDFGSTRCMHLTLGYRQLPLAFGKKQHIDICLAVYEKHSVAMSSVPVPRRGSAARCNPPTDDEAEDESHTRHGARRTLFVELPDEDKPEGQFDEPEPQQQTLERTPARAEATTQYESAQALAFEEPSAASIISYTPRKRHIASSGGEVKPKRTPKLNRLRF
ncbi:hypothetical protein KR032_007007, partial [Drosophila birchii]